MGDFVGFDLMKYVEWHARTFKNGLVRAVRRLKQKTKKKAPRKATRRKSK